MYKVDKSTRNEDMTQENWEQVFEILKYNLNNLNLSIGITIDDYNKWLENNPKVPTTMTDK